jgi:predicted site-specific integrase-resolvase
VTRLRPHLAAKVFGISPRTLHKWAREGRIVRHSDGFDLEDLLQAEASRDQAALMARAGIPRSVWSSSRRVA